MRRTKKGARHPARRATPLTLLLATGLWGARSLTGCSAESIRVGAFGDAGAGGEISDGGAADPGGTGSGGRSAQGGRGNVGGQGNVGGSDSEGGKASGGSAASAGSSGSFGNGGFAGGIAGYGGDATHGGSIGYAGGAGSGAQAGNGGSAGTFGYAGGAGTGDVLELAPPEEAPCAQDVCTGRFEWVSEGKTIFADLSGNAQVIAGWHNDETLSRAYRLIWWTRMMRMVPGDESFLPLATNFTGTTLVGKNLRVTGNGVPEPLPYVPNHYEATSISDDGNVIALTDLGSSYMVLGDQRTSISDVRLWAVSGNGEVFGGTRESEGRAVIVTAAGELTELPLAGDWLPEAVYALSEDGSVAVGDASTAARDRRQAFRWVKGAELELLGFPEGTTELGTIALDCDADCSIVVGTTWDAEAPIHEEPFVYTADGGLVTLAEYAFEHTGLVVPTDLDVDKIRISADGRFIAGGGFSGALFYFKLDLSDELPTN